MQPVPTSTVAQLLFTTAPDLGFARIVGDLDHALAAAGQKVRALIWDHDDIASFDLEGGRIMLGLTDGLPGRFAACLTVSVGDGPAAGSRGIALRQSAISRMIADRIAERHPPDEMRWHEIPAVVDALVIDALVDAVLAEATPAPAAAPAGQTPPAADDASAPEVAAEDAAPAAAAAAPAPEAASEAAPARKAPSFAEAPDAIELPRILAQYDARLAARQTHGDRAAPGSAGVRRPRRRGAARPAPSPGTAQGPAPLQVANDMPQIPQPRLSEAAAIRAALYDPLPEEERAPAMPPTLRLAAHAMNATLLVIALPVGASLMTYSLLRGENLHLSARALAVMGLLVGLMQLPMGGGLAFEI
jgi:hypothetical protein